MIDEKRLDELNSGLVCLVPKPESITESSTLLTCHEYSKSICDCELQELIKLARLGLWSETFVIPFLSTVFRATYWPAGNIPKSKLKKEIQKIITSLPIESLPKEEK